jgi:predicted PurR-regulated permease PerM
MATNHGFGTGDEFPPDVRNFDAPEPQRSSMLAGIKPNAAATWGIAFAVVLAGLFTILLFARPIALLVSGIIIAQALIPIVDRLSGFMKRGVAIALTYVSLLALLVLISWIIIPALIEQGEDLVERAPDLYERAQNWLAQHDVLNDRITTEDLEEQIVGQIGQFGSQLVGLPLTIVSTAFDVLLVIIISIYWILAGPSLRSFALSLFPFERQGKADSVMSEMGQTMGGYVRGIAINASLISILAFTGLSIIGVQYALVLALIAGILDIVPIVGPIIATVPIVGVALLDSPTTAIITLIFWIVLQQVESYLLMPFVMQSQAEVPPLLVLLAIFWGGSVGGILGALVAIPVAGALRVFFLRVIAPGIRRWTGAIDGDVHGPPPPPMSQVES